MKISTEINSAASIIGEEKAIEQLAKAGFDAWDFSMFLMCRYDRKNACFLETNHPLATDDYIKFARQLKRVADDNGIHCNQSHAPFPSCKATMPYLMRAIECTAEVGGDICVIHPANDGTPDENAQMYRALLPFAKECGVRIAAENMWNWNHDLHQAAPAACSDPESFNAHLDAVNDPNLIACLDLGHAEMKGLNTSAVEMIYALGDRLQALHIHDNDLQKDSHQIPFSMSMDFSAIIKALKSIGYSGYFTLEADQYLSAYTRENVFDGICRLANSARLLTELFENA